RVRVRRLLRASREDDEVQQKPGTDRTDVEHPWVTQKLGEVATDRAWSRCVWGTEIDQQKTRAHAPVMGTCASPIGKVKGGADRECGYLTTPQNEPDRSL